MDDDDIVMLQMTCRKVQRTLIIATTLNIQTFKHEVCAYIAAFCSLNFSQPQLCHQQSTISAQLLINISIIPSFKLSIITMLSFELVISET